MKIATSQQRTHKFINAYKSAEFILTTENRGARAYSVLSSIL